MDITKVIKGREGSVFQKLISEIFQLKCSNPVLSDTRLAGRMSAIILSLADFKWPARVSLNFSNVCFKNDVTDKTWLKTWKFQHKSNSSNALNLCQHWVSASHASWTELQTLLVCNLAYDALLFSFLHSICFCVCDSNVPSKLCTCAHAHRSWDGRTQENLERT